MGRAVGQALHAAQDALGDAQPIRRHQRGVEPGPVVADGDLEAVGGGQDRDRTVHRSDHRVVPGGGGDRVAQGLADGAEDGRHGHRWHGAFDVDVLAGARRDVDPQRGIRGDLLNQPADAADGLGDQHHRLNGREAQRVELAEGFRRVPGDHLRRGAAQARHQQGGDDAVVYERIDGQPLLPAGDLRGAERFGLPGEQGGIVDAGRGPAGSEGEGDEHAHQQQGVEPVGEADEGRVGLGRGAEPHHPAQGAGQQSEPPGHALTGKNGHSHTGHPREGDHPGDVGAGGHRFGGEEEPETQDQDETERRGGDDDLQDARRGPPHADAESDGQTERHREAGRGRRRARVAGLGQEQGDRQEAEDAGRGGHGDAEQPGEVGGGGVSGVGGPDGLNQRKGVGLDRLDQRGWLDQRIRGAHEWPGTGRMPSSRARLYRSILVFAGRPTRSYLERTRRM
nr:hypothetical protein BJQ95_01132 [Cryobacterium sp. SO1]